MNTCTCRTWQNFSRNESICFGLEHLFVSNYLFVWPFTGLINHDDESKRGNICEVDEDHDDAENLDEDAGDDFDEKEGKQKSSSTKIFYIFLAF